MIQRYASREIDASWNDLAKLPRWQETELTVLKVRTTMGGPGHLPQEDYETIERCLVANPPDVEWWKARDKEIGHDLNAFIDERRRHLPPELRHWCHKDMTSYDTEDPAFSRVILASLVLVSADLHRLFAVMRAMAATYRYMPFLDRTHGQWAKIKSFGMRVLNWLTPLGEAAVRLTFASDSCRFSRLSGAIGNYGGGLTPDMEKKSLSEMGLKPFYGATQILPRVIYAAAAQALVLVAEEIGKIAHDIRLGTRNPWPLWHEPFGKKQKGSSAMPHKKNPILTERICGMVLMAEGYGHMIVSSVRTWESRAIEQSCVERVAWPDLLHTVLNMIAALTKVLEGLVVYPDNMLREIIESRDTYASEEAKNFLGDLFAREGLDAEEAYRAVQLACFNALEPSKTARAVRNTHHVNLDEAFGLMETLRHDGESYLGKPGIKLCLAEGLLFHDPNLAATEDDVAEWNRVLKKIFGDAMILAGWDEQFTFQFLLRHEPFLFDTILGG